MRYLLPDSRVLLAFLLLFLSYEPLNLWPFVFFALIPLFEYLYQERKKRRAFTQLFALSWLFSLTTFYWVAYVLRQFGGLNWFFAILLLGVFALVGQPQFYLFALPIRSLLQRWTRGPLTYLRTIAYAAWIAAFYAGLDWCLPKLFADTLGIGFSGVPSLRQLVTLGGPAVLTFLVVFINAVLWFCYRLYRDHDEPSLQPFIRKIIPLLATIALVLGASVQYGNESYEHFRAIETAPPRTLQGAIIQANIGDIDKLAAERGYRGATKKVMEAYFGLSDVALAQPQKPQVLFWPETSYPSDFGAPESAEDFSRDRSMENFAKTRNVPIIFGGYYSDEKRVPYNAAFFLSPDGQVNRYFKSILLWFGETIPFIDYLPVLRRMFPMVGFFGRGEGPTVLPLLGIPVQPIICYEALFPNFIADGVRKGARIILNFTNDSWFGPYGAPYYHFRLAQLRSIETRTPQVRITNTGISGLILPSGDVVSRSPLFEPVQMPVTIPILPEMKTPAIAIGDLGIKGLGLLALALFLWSSAKTQTAKRRKKKQGQN